MCERIQNLEKKIQIYNNLACILVKIPKRKLKQARIYSFDIQRNYMFTMQQLNYLSSKLTKSIEQTVSIIETTNPV